MNGQTTIDATLNPCSADVDRHTYGCRLANVTTFGQRLIRIGICQVYIDIYWSGWHWPRYMRVHNGAVWFVPGGSIQWPMPVRAQRRTARVVRATAKETA